jgi:methionyl-tRNA formyltransferase
MEKGGDLVVKTVSQIRDDSYSIAVQNEQAALNAAPKLFKENCKIDWSQSSLRIYNFIRGLSPYPAAWAELEGKMFKVFETEIIQKSIEGDPGAVETDDKNLLFVKTGDGAIKITNLQLQGKKRMKTEDFLRGNKI